MRILGLTITRSSASEAPETAKSMRERVHRLEIALGELEEAHAVLQGHHVKLRNLVHGERGGRPPARPASQNQQPLALDEIKPGDKAALRRHFGLVPRSTKQE